MAEVDIKTETQFSQTKTVMLVLFATCAKNYFITQAVIVS